MAQGKYCKVGGVIKTIIGEYTKMSGVIKTGLINCPKIGGVIKQISLAERRIYATEQFSERCYCIDDQGVEVWNYYVAGLVDPTAVAVDSAGNSYWACANNVYKLDADGNLAAGWPYTGHSAAVLSIAVDKDGYVYTGDFSGIVKKLNSGGGLEWTETLGANYAVYSLCVDHGTDFVFAGTGRAEFAVYRIRISTGLKTRIYWYPAEVDVTAIAADEDGDLYIGVRDIGEMKKISMGGYVYWTKTFLGDITQIVIGHDGWGYCSNGSYRAIRKFARSDGAVSWIYTPAGSARAEGCGVDQGGNAYGAYRKTGTSVENVVRKINSSGNWVWSWSPYVSAQMYGIAVTPGLKAAGF